MNLRCANKLHGIVDGDIIEVSCNSQFCGSYAGIVVLHKFNLNTGELIETRTFKEPVKAIPRDVETGDEMSRDISNSLKENDNGSRRSVSIRST
ncbi:MAG: hypothetical protein ACRD42_05115 [Nitrososphaeraceae archaeon]